LVFAVAKARAVDAKIGRALVTPRAFGIGQQPDPELRVRNGKDWGRPARDSECDFAIDQSKKETTRDE